MCRYGVFASRWPLGEQTVWTIVNRNDYDVEGPQIDLPCRKRACATSICITAPNSHRIANQAGRMVLSFDIEAHGYGALLGIRIAPDATIQA